MSLTNLMINSVYAETAKSDEYLDYGQQYNEDEIVAFLGLYDEKKVFKATFYEELSAIEDKVRKGIVELKKDEKVLSELIEEFKINSSFLSEEEQQNIAQEIQGKREEFNLKRKNLEQYRDSSFNLLSKKYASAKQEAAIEIAKEKRLALIQQIVSDDYASFSNLSHPYTLDVTDVMIGKMLAKKENAKEKNEDVSDFADEDNSSAVSVE